MTDLLATIFTLGFVAQVLRIAVPYALAAMGGAVTERSGVIDLALEAKLLFGAFAAAAVGHATDSGVLGIVGGAGAGMIVAAIQIGCALGLGANQVIVGVALTRSGSPARGSCSSSCSARARTRRRARRTAAPSSATRSSG